MIENDSKIYILFERGNYNIVVYDVTSDSFISYVEFTSGYTIYKLDSNGDFIHFVGYSSGNECYLGKTLSNTNLNEHSYLTSLVGAMTALSPAEFPISNESPSAKIASITSLTSSPIAISEDLSSYEESTGTPYESDVSFNSDPVYSTNLSEDSKLYIPVILTCSRTGTTPITYSITNLGSSPAPTWVILNEK
jgi:hypothetical protein